MAFNTTIHNFTIVCGIIGFLGAQICMTENKHFVTEAKWQESREELIDRINNVDSKHTINYGKLSEKIAEATHIRNNLMRCKRYKPTNETVERNQR